MYINIIKLGIMMKNLTIRLKLIIIFIFIKVIPLILIAYLCIQSAIKLNEYYLENTEAIYIKNKLVIQATAYESISDSIKALDEKSQESIEKMTVDIASNVASFLYERDNDLLFLSSLKLNQNIIENFYKTKSKEIKVTPTYIYNKNLKKWLRREKKEELSISKNSQLKDNEKEFRIINPSKLNKLSIPLYKEVVFFNLEGKEIYKKSSINETKNVISLKENTYIRSENYFSSINNLKKGEIYVSDVIGEYVKSNIIGTFSKEKTDNNGIEFNPKEHAFAGIENPIGKKFDGIIRYITPIFENDKKIGFISLALDHRHIMEFTDTFNPLTNQKELDISDASNGNYAFMWDYEGRNISHPRDYFIVGFDSSTGERVPGWISESLLSEFKKSSYKDLNSFLKKHPKFHEQSLVKKPNRKQLKEKGEVGLDCRYLDFAPQCKGWMELTQNGGYGSFIIYWSNVWKLTTAATIPYYTGQYKNSKRGFGFVTIGANVDEFHSAANKTKENIKDVIDIQTKDMTEVLTSDRKKIKTFQSDIIKELTFYTILMIIIVILIALWMSSFISNKIKKLIVGTKEFAENNLDYRIKVESCDELGKLENSFNEMAQRLKNNSIKIKEQDSIMTQQAKMAAMGEMLENIAHQWRQPLSMISTCASSTKIQFELSVLKEEDLEEHMNNILKYTSHLSQTIDDFRNFFKPNKAMNNFSIEHSLNKTLHLISSKLKNQNVEIIKDIEDVIIFGLENELMHVLINIINNALDAFAENQNLKKLILINVRRKENELIIKIQDSAKGIPEEIIKRIFEPYFTTKDASDGTGIGLYMTEEIIVEHMNGQISVKNKEFLYKNDKFFGAMFKIRIPLN